MSEVQVYGIGLVCASACVPADMSREAVEAEVNRQHPPGGELRWVISTDKTFRDGVSPNPCQCDQGPARLHYLLNC